jgi:hypothetical protein
MVKNANEDSKRRKLTEMRSYCVSSGGKTDLEYVRNEGCK